MVAATPLAFVRQHPVFVGCFFAMVAGFSYGTSHFVGRMLVTTVAPPLVVGALGALFGLFYLAVLTHRQVPQALRAPRRALLCMVLAGVTGSTGVLCMLVALSLSPVIYVSPIAALQPLVALLWTHLFLQRLERVTLRIVLGAVMVVGGVAMIAASNA